MSLSLFSASEKKLIAALAFMQFSHIVDFMILMPLGPQLMRIFQIDPHQFGLLVSSYTFAAGATGLISAFFIDQFDRKTSLLFFYAGFGVGTLACAWAPSYEFLLLARTLTGAFGGVISSLVLAIVADAIGPERRATATGLVMTAFSLASVMGVPFSLFLANEFGWHAPFLFLGVVAVLLFAMVARVIPPIRGHLHEGKLKQVWYVPVLQIFEDRNRIWSLVFQLLLVFGHFSIIPFLSPSLVANAGLPEAQLPLIYLVGGLVSIVGGPFVGRMADLHGKKRVFVLGTLLSMIPLYLITHLGVTPLPLILAVVALFFFCMSGRVVPATALVTSTVRPEMRGTFMSIVSSVQQFSAALASWMAGLIVIRATDGTLQNYTWVGWIAIGFSFLAIVINRKIIPLEGDSR